MNTRNLDDNRDKLLREMVIALREGKEEIRKAIICYIAFWILAIAIGIILLKIANVI